MLPKAAKCLGNLANVVRALAGSDEQGEELIKRPRDEAMAVWRACEIEWEDYGRFRRRLEADPGKRKLPEGYEDERIFGSTWQSLQRRSGSIETGLLNGEVAHLGELVGVMAHWSMM